MNTSRNSQGRDRCGARRRDGSGKTCGLPAGWGTDHVGHGPCRKHLGTTPAHQAHAQKLMAEDAVRKFGLPVRTTATAALQAELERSAGAIEFLLAKVRELDERAWTWGGERITRTTTEGRGGRPTVTEDVSVIKTGPNVWVRLLNEERRHFAEVARVMCSLDIDTKAVSVAEQYGQQMAGALSRAVAGAGLDPADAAKVVALLPRELRAISGRRPADERLSGTRPARVTACQP